MRYLEKATLVEMNTAQDFIKDFERLFGERMLVNKKNMDKLRLSSFNASGGWKMSATFEIILRKENLLNDEWHDYDDNWGLDYIDIFIKLYNGSKDTLVDKIVKQALK
jgi:hypothetical protein